MALIFSNKVSVFVDSALVGISCFRSKLTSSPSLQFISLSWCFIQRARGSKYSLFISLMLFFITLQNKILIENSRVCSHGYVPRWRLLRAQPSIFFKPCTVWLQLAVYANAFPRIWELNSYIKGHIYGSRVKTHYPSLAAESRMIDTWWCLWVSSEAPTP